MQKFNYDSFHKYFAIALGVWTALLHIGQFTVFPMESIKFYVWHLMLGLSLVFLYKPCFANASRKWLIADWALIVISFTAGIIVILNYDDYIMIMQGSLPNTQFIVLGTLLTLLSLEAARRMLGLILPLISLLAIAYALFGGDLPGLLAHRGYTFVRVISAIFSDQGLYGTPIGVSASNIYLFLLFASLLNASGADSIFQNIAIALTGKKRGGPAKMSVVASCLFGSISGSAVANVMSTGSFTIPLMKRLGYQKRFAGAVEAVASTGGQIMPPIMGAAAFILSDIASVPYATVCIAALLPSLMYFLTLFKMVDLESVKHKLEGLPPETLPNLKKEFKRSFKLIVPLIVLLVFLFGFKATPMIAVIYSIIALLLCSIIGKERLTIKKTISGLVSGSKNLTPVVSACACSGIVTAMLAITGLGLKFSNFIVQLGGSSILLSLILAMFVCIILGMGLPATAAYIICAAAIAPALVKIGMASLPAHLFLLYFASISAITPPVAVASYAAAGIAKENAMKIGITAVKLGIAGFALPFTFALNADYLHFGFDLKTLFTWVSAWTVCYSASIIIQGYTEQKITVIERLLYCFVVIMAIQSNYIISASGWLLFAALYWGVGKLRAKHGEQNREA
ncbi:MAG: TRAP transporter fused permease subunit [Elusimicrobiota bacterium]|jgi:TRAP transporter 4TM/12TM fusion protein|nr:TRAP transporter fused permease subunit [Elusimicrobiota bacterium]